jgi:alpha/beta superfamily hydrolase
MRLSLDGPCGALEAELWLPMRDGEEDPEPRVACAFCHPHPRRGGTMKSSVVFRAGRGLQAAGVAVLRFNFRGVGRSAPAPTGVAGGERAAEKDDEHADLAAALAHLAARYPSAELWAGGFSFGARIAAGQALRDERIARLVLVALPVLQFDTRRSRSSRHRPRRDGRWGRLRPARGSARLLPGLEGHFEFVSIAGANHFFQDHTRELEARVRDFAERELRQHR